MLLLSCSKQLVLFPFARDTKPILRTMLVTRYVVKFAFCIAEIDPLTVLRETAGPCGRLRRPTQIFVRAQCSFLVAKSSEIKSVRKVSDQAMRSHVRAHTQSKVTGMSGVLNFISDCIESQSVNGLATEIHDNSDIIIFECSHSINVR